VSKDEIYLRTLEETDVDFMLQMENDIDIWRVSQTLEPYSYEDIKHFILASSHNLVEDKQIRYVIVLSKNDKQIGSVDLFDYNAKKKSAGVGITILKPYRKKNYGKMALLKLIEHAFSELHLVTLYCTIFTDNEASIRLFESVGFQRIKLLKDSFM